MKLVLGPDSLLGGPLCPPFVISLGRTLGQIENGATTRFYDAPVAVSPIVTCASHAASHDCTLYERIFLKCLSYSLQSMQRMRTLRYFYRRFYFLLISRKKTQILNNFYKSYILSFCYFNVKTKVLQVNNLRTVRVENNNILENYWIAIIVSSMSRRVK